MTGVAKQSHLGLFFGLYQNLFAASVRSIAFRLTAVVWINVPCEEAFPQLKINKSRHQNRLTDEHLKYCLHLSLNNYEHLQQVIARYAVSCINFAIIIIGSTAVFQP